MSIEEQNKQETPEERAKRLLATGEFIPPKKLTPKPEWNYATSKDLSMNIGGLVHDATTLVAATIIPGTQTSGTEEVAHKVMLLTEQLYLKKEELINKIKNL